MNTAMHLTKCAKFGCNERFFNWNAVEFNYCGELHRTCSYTCLHYVKQAVVCRITDKHRQLMYKQRQMWRNA
jgi:hypothetical protein